MALRCASVSDLWKVVTSVSDAAFLAGLDAALALAGKASGIVAAAATVVTVDLRNSRRVKGAPPWQSGQGVVFMTKGYSRALEIGSEESGRFLGSLSRFPLSLFPTPHFLILPPPYSLPPLASPSRASRQNSLSPKAASWLTVPAACSRRSNG